MLKEEFSVTQTGLQLDISTSASQVLGSQCVPPFLAETSCSLPHLVEFRCVHYFAAPYLASLVGFWVPTLLFFSKPISCLHLWGLFCSLKL